MKLLRQQQQVVAEHWDIPSRSLIKASSQSKKENVRLERELEARKGNINEKLKNDIEGMKEKVGNLKSLNNVIATLNAANAEMCTKVQRIQSKLLIIVRNLTYISNFAISVCLTYLQHLRFHKTPLQGRNVFPQCTHSLQIVSHYCIPYVLTLNKLGDPNSHPHESKKRFGCRRVIVRELK